MNLHEYKNLNQIQPDEPVCICIGLFDAFHLGHQRILEELNRFSTELNLLSGVWTFSTFPPKLDEDRLLHPVARDLLFEKTNVQVVHKVPFEPWLSELSAEDFLQEILINRLNTHAIVLGKKSRLGNNRQCSATCFLEMAEKAGLKTRLVSTLQTESKAISTRDIKTLVRKGKIREASRLLGRPFTISGIVGEGDARGRRIGFPTANISMQGRCIPPEGVWITRATNGSPAGRLAATYIGTRPTFDGVERKLEAYFPDWSGDLYGEYLEFEPIQFLREDIKFDSGDELRRQIEQDVLCIKRLQGPTV